MTFSLCVSTIILTVLLVCVCLYIIEKTHRAVEVAPRRLELTETIFYALIGIKRINENRSCLHLFCTSITNKRINGNNL
jgi:hypothetical protein